MQLRKLIGEIGAKYDRLLPMSSEAHGLLRQAEAEFKQWIPAGYLVEGSGGKGQPAITPRIAIFNPDETTTTRQGMYLAYLFAADNSTVTLTLNQGVGEMAEHLGRAGARLVLSLEASTIRAALRPKDIADLDITFDLQTTAASSVDYQHTNIVSRTYSLDNLAGESKLVADLRRFIRLYTLAIEAREVAHRRGHHELLTPAKRPAARVVTKSAPEPETKREAKQAQEPPAKPVTEKAATPNLIGKRPAKSRLIGKKKTASPDVKKGTAAALPQPDTSKKGAAPEIRVAHEHKLLTSPMKRRGLLAALVAAPIAYVTPMATAAPRRQSAITQMPRPAQTTPVFTIDVSQHDWRRRGGNLDWSGIRRGGIAGMCARATYGDPSGYNWPTYHFGDFARAARDAGMSLRGGYHNVVRGDQQSINRQVDWLRRELDRHDATWAMLDVERYAELVKADMWPRWEDVRRFDDRWAEVESRVLVGYIPPWNWSNHLGQPDLREFRGPLIASNYPSNANEDYRRLYERIGGNDGRGWAAYGGRVPEGWQYSSRAKVPGAPNICDVNAWRLSFEQLKALLIGKRQAGRTTPARPDL